jgi:hypothetical protein
MPAVIQSAARFVACEDAAYYGLMGGLIGGIVAGPAGAMNYGTIPDKSPAKKLGGICVTTARQMNSKCRETKALPKPWLQLLMKRLEQADHI